MHATLIAMTEGIEEIDHGELKEAPLPSRSAVVRGLVVLVMLGAFVPSVLGLLGRWGWLLDLCNHFRFQSMVILFATSVALLLLRCWKRAGISLAGIVLNLMFVLPLYLGSPGPVDTSLPTFTVMHFNVNTGNKDHAGVIEEVQKHAPDLLFVQEVNQRWVDALSVGLVDYELVVIDSRTDNFGTCCFVRRQSDVLSVEDAQIVQSPVDAGEVPMIELALASGGRRVRVLSIHPLPPVSVIYARARDAMLDDAGQWSTEQSDPHFIVGDFNATPWSTAFRDLQSAGGLVNSQVGFGRGPTWPAKFNTLGMIPIDHLLHSEELVTIDRVVGEANGSDHKPLIVEIGWHR